MLSSIPQSFVSSSALNARYSAIRGTFMPLLRSKAKFASLAGFIDQDDLLQEMEMRALYRLPMFDQERSSLTTWIGLIATRTVADFLNYAGRQSRAPRHAMEWDGGWVEVQGHAASLDEMLEEHREGGGSGDGKLFIAGMFEESAEDYSVSREYDVRAQGVRATFRARVNRLVGGFTRDLFWARINPPVELLIFARNKTGRLPEAPDQLRLETISAYYEVAPPAARAAWADLCSAVRRVTGEFDADDRCHLGG
jgi:DNA-directed RNA polymerase specialized sigma24 family protein